MSSDFFMITPSPVLSAFIWFAVGMALMYVARQPAHRAIDTVSRGLQQAFRLGSRAVVRAEHFLTMRNREVLLAAGREAKERIIEREFDRVNDTVRRDLAGYPALHRKLSDALSKIEADHEQSTEIPPEPPGWVKAVDAVAAIPSKGDYMVGNVLADIHKSLVKAHNQAIEEYRDSSRTRHGLLEKMRPNWRRMLKVLGQVDRNVTSLLERSRTIDRHMEEYEEMVRGTDRATQMLSSSSLVQFFISGFVLVIAAGLTAVNFSLIARPMAEMVGGTGFIGTVRAADVAALFIIMVEMAMGLFLMECLRITRIFPVIGALQDKLRVRMGWICFGILLFFASLEAGLAYMREILMQDELATNALLRGDTSEMAASGSLWITTATQMGMGFMLPFVLAFVAIPLEAFVHSLRTVLGFAFVAALRVLGVVLRLVGNVLRQLGIVSQHVYDMVVFAPLWIERRVRSREEDDLAGRETYGEVS